MPEDREFGESNLDFLPLPGPRAPMTYGPQDRENAFCFEMSGVGLANHHRRRSLDRKG